MYPKKEIPEPTLRDFLNEILCYRYPCLSSANESALPTSPRLKKINFKNPESEFVFEVIVFSDDLGGDCAIKHKGKKPLLVVIKEALLEAIDIVDYNAEGQSEMPQQQIFSGETTEAPLRKLVLKLTATAIYENEVNHRVIPGRKAISRQIGAWLTEKISIPGRDVTIAYISQPYPLL